MSSYVSNAAPWAWPASLAFLVPYMPLASTSAQRQIRAYIEQIEPAVTSTLLQMRAARIFAWRGVGGKQRSALQGRLLSPTPLRSTRRLSSLSAATQRFLDDAGCTVPIIKGPMYPGSNPELVAALSAAGGLGVVQPISLTHLYGHDFREGLQLIKSLTDKPFGVNFTILENKKRVV